MRCRGALSLRSPAVVGGAKRAEQSFLALAGDSGLSLLSAGLPFNGMTSQPAVRLEGKHASASVWTPVVGTPTLAIASTGTAPTVGLDTPLTTDTDKLVVFNAGQVYQSSQAALGDVTTHDLVIEALVYLHPTAETSRTIASKRGTTGAGWALSMSTATAGRVSLTLSDGTNTATFSTATLVLGAWYHLLFFVDRSESSTTTGIIAYANGVATVGVSANPALVTGSLTNAKLLTVGADSDLGGKTTQGLAYLAVYARNNWLPGGASNTSVTAAVAKERTQRLMGLYPQLALGTAAPSNQSRTSTAYLDKVDPTTGVRSHFLVGAGWTRIARRKSRSGQLVTGLLPEPGKTNLLLQSETLDHASWTKTACTVTANQRAAPNGLTSMDALVADGTGGPHALSQAVTLTAAVYTFSAFVAAGSASRVVLENTTIANGAVWFDLAAGTVGTTQAGIGEARISSWGNGIYRVSARFTGTVAAHTLRLAPAAADGSMAFTGDAVAASLYVYGMQCEAGDVSTYYPTTTAAAARAADVFNWLGSDGNIAIGPCAIAFDFLGPDTDFLGSSTLFITGTTGGSTIPNGIAFSLAANDSVQLAGRVASSIAFNMTGSADVMDGEKHNIRGYASLNDARLVIDGVVQGTDAIVPMPTAPPANICPFSVVNGLLANIAIWNGVNGIP